MSAQQLVLAWQQPDLTPAQRLVLMDLADCADREGRNAFRSERTIADHTMLSRRTVQLALKTLRNRGLLVVQALPTARSSTTYELQLRTHDRRRSDAGEGRIDYAPERRKSDAPGAKSGAISGAISLQIPFPVPGDDNPRPGHGLGAAMSRSPLPHTPYKDDPVDPDDPGAVALLVKVVLGIWIQYPERDGIPLLRDVTTFAKQRGWPHDVELVTRAIECARHDRRVTA